MEMIFVIFKFFGYLGIWNKEKLYLIKGIASKYYFSRNLDSIKALQRFRSMWHSIIVCCHVHCNHASVIVWPQNCNQ